MTARQTGRANRRTRVDPEILDRAHLVRYTLSDSSLEREIIGLFLAQLPLLLSQLKVAADAADWKMASHTLKGSARAVGAARIAVIAERLEERGWGKDRSRLRDLLAETERAISEFADVAKRLYP